MVEDGLNKPETAISLVLPSALAVSLWAWLSVDFL